jgi:hypothetical protein
MIIVLFESYSFQGLQNGLSSLSKIITTSGFSNQQIGLSAEGRRFLSQTIKGPITVYRGFHAMRNRFSPKNFLLLKSLSPGSIAPNFISSNNKNDFTSTSKSFAVAKRYSKGGNIEIILSANVQKPQIICDTTNIKKVIGNNIQDLLTDSDFDYFEKEKEVIVNSDIQYTVVNILIKN